jgi:hypothetical protein
MSTDIGVLPVHVHPYSLSSNCAISVNCGVECWVLIALNKLVGNFIERHMARLTRLRSRRKAVWWGLVAGTSFPMLVALGVSMSSTQARVTPAGDIGLLATVPGGPAQFELGEDTYICLGALATVAGTHGDDIITGTDGPDVIHGRGGNDTIDGKGGDDLLCGGSGDDFILGGPGDDMIRGWSGDDFINGGPGSDTMLADEGNDQVVGEDGRDFLSGSDGDDILIGGDFLLEDERIESLSGNDVFLGGLGKDTIIGDDGDDSVLAFGGNDFVLTGEGEDYINGFGGDDFFEAGTGEDTCLGGPGTDSAANCEIQSEIERQDTRKFPFIP